MKSMNLEQFTNEIHALIDKKTESVMDKVFEIIAAIRNKRQELERSVNAHEVPHPHQRTP